MATTTIYTILKEFRDAATNNRDMGDKFERLIAQYFVTDPQYLDLFSDVWLWSEWPDRGNQPDTGIDIVAKMRYTEGYCAIQCKFYNPYTTLMKEHIDSFFTASGRKPFTSRMIISTTNNWSKHAEEALIGQHIPVQRLRVEDLAESPVDWSQFVLGKPKTLKRKEKKKLYEHQKKALANVVGGLKTAERGKLIMACGTGKTFTALKITEKMVPLNGHVLFLVPSISLLSQSLREWTAQSDVSLHSHLVCSDTQAGKKKTDTEDIPIHDLAFPSTTDPKVLYKRLEAFRDKDKLTVIFSTYQSIQVISDAQKMGAPEFDLIICDEAHRTTGVTIEGEDESYFVKVHDQSFLKAKKRLYMTATPRIYSDGSKSKAEDAGAEICSMDDEKLYGKELHRLDFSEAVGNDLLSDYKVMVLAVDEKYVDRIFQKQLADENSELRLDDVIKITGCWNGLSKRFAFDPNDKTLEVDSSPMRRAVAFSRSIKDSQNIKRLFSGIIEKYRELHQDDESWLSCEVDHVDGTMNALVRNEKLDWLKEDTSDKGNICRILSNARCLSEGVDVPALDAVLFLNPRNSVIDVVQSVGRVMRKSPGKKYGYIILPIGVPTDVPPDEALNDNQKYKVVWQVLQALRAHDDRFNATINQLELNKTRPPKIQIIGVGGPADEKGDKTGDGKPKKPEQLTINFPNLEEWKDAIYAKMVLKCGNRAYWENWAKDVAQIADRHVNRIENLLEKTKHRKAFNEFLEELQDNINPSVEKDEAIEMLSQHLITRPIFDALFKDYQFTKYNPVSLAMQKMLDLLEDQNLEKETETLDKFYASVKQKIEGIDNHEGKQKIIKDLYEKFFETAFPKLSDKLGIVYTPIEIVDFIVKSVDEALRQEFNSSLTDKGVHILDPFTGTGTFMVRLLQSGLIDPKDLKRKYEDELHANEIVLLAYYIAAINIEETYHSLVDGDYKPFDGIVLTDTFQLAEGAQEKIQQMLPDNSNRVKRQKKKEIRVIIGNPPYSVGQESENDANKNQPYPNLDDSIRNSYAKFSSATNKNSLYNSYIRAFRWASNRIGNRGIICYISNGSLIDKNTTDGLRYSFYNEFSSIYCFNLRGNAHYSGEQRKKEKGNVFGAGTKDPIAITLLVKNPDKKEACQLFYHDIGDYLSQKEKLDKISEFGSIGQIPWKNLVPNTSHDWINQRDPMFDTFISVGDKKGKEDKVVFDIHSRGIATCRDPWAYNASHNKLIENMQKTISFFNSQTQGYRKACANKPKSSHPTVDEFINNDPHNISWSDTLKGFLSKCIDLNFDYESITQVLHRPFCKQWGYYNKYFNERRYLMPQIFPSAQTHNLAICLTGMGANKDFSALITNVLPDVQLISNGQCFPLHYFDKPKHKNDNSNQESLFGETTNTRKDGISDDMFSEFRTTYDKKISKEDIFYYVYGVLHSPEYKTRFADDLKKMLPRIPKTGDFWAFSKAGRALAEWHLNYETVKPYPLEILDKDIPLDPKEHYRVTKMYFGKKDKQEDRTSIIYNSKVSLHNIPLETYDYIVNGKSAIEWIMDRYQLRTDGDSGITNDPNDWSDDPKYILNLLCRIVTVSIETMKIIKKLPPLKEKV